MSAFVITLIILAVVAGLPVIAYMVMKFGMSGYLRAKQRFMQKQNKKDQNNE